MAWLETRAIYKGFSRKEVLKGVSLSFETGKCYALLGENGAGKTTFSRILAGSTAPDSGSVLLDDTPLTLRSPRDAHREGITMVHQTPLLADELTVLENIMLGSEPTGVFGSLRKKSAAVRITELCAAWDISLNLDGRAGSLGAADRFYTAFFSALFKAPAFLILDEPSASLSSDERANLFSHLDVAVHGTGSGAGHSSTHEPAGNAIPASAAPAAPLCVIFITHNIEEAVQNADQTIVLRDGTVTSCFYRGDPRATEAAVTAAIFGTELEHEPADAAVGTALGSGTTLPAGTAFGSDTTLQAGTAFGGIPQAVPVSDAPVRADSAPALFTLENLTLRPPHSPALYNINLTIPEGSFTAVSGQKESGLSTLEDLLTGFCAAPHEGTVSFMGTPAKSLTPHLLREASVALVASNKNYRSSNPLLSVRELLTSHWGAEKAVLTQSGIAATLDDSTATLSGGMLQNLIVTRELAHHPRAIILANPAYGLDRRNTLALLEKLQAANRAGVTVVVLTVAQDELFEAAKNRYTLVSGELRTAPESRSPADAWFPPPSGVFKNTEEASA